MAFTKTVEIKKEDVVKIQAQGAIREGKVLSAEFWDAETGWYIELVDAKYGYAYWKQRYDGGKLLEVNG